MAIAAHPDDIERWCAGALARTIEAGATVRLLRKGPRAKVSRQNEWAIDTTTPAGRLCRDDVRPAQAAFEQAFVGLIRERSPEASTIWSVAGLLPRHGERLSRRPFRAPHHTISVSGLIGGGSPRTRALRLHAGQEFQTSKDCAMASEQQSTERLLDLLDGSLILVTFRKTAGRAPSCSRHPRERRRRGELRRQGRVENFFERDVERVSKRRALLGRRPTVAAFQTSVAQVVRELINDNSRV